jgi:DnaD/phage-associated family protein
MPTANGDYVKVYLYLLRNVLSGQSDFTTKQTAKQLQLIESDVIRALNYWNELRFIEVIFEDEVITSIGLLSLEKTQETISTPIEKKRTGRMAESNPEPKVKLYERPEYTMEEVSAIADQSDFRQLLYITEKYLGKRLTQVDVNILVGFLDWLGLNIEVVEFLIEHCASNGHRHMNYIEKVAIDWSDQNITTVEQAKVHTETFNKSYFRIFKALGLSSRQPTPSQLKLMDRWIHDYNFAIEVIEKACEKTIASINKPELKYVDTILTRWHNKGVKSLEAIEELDATFKTEQTTKNDTKKVQPLKTNNRFHNHDQRQYDYDLIEKRMNEMMDQETKEKRS